MNAVMIIVVFIGTKFDIDYIPMANMPSCERAAIEMKEDMLEIDVLKDYSHFSIKCSKVWIHR